MRFKHIEEVYGKVGRHDPKSNDTDPDVNRNTKNMTGTDDTTDTDDTTGTNDTQDYKSVDAKGSPSTGKGQTMPKSNSSQITESNILFEIDYNSRDIVKQALRGPVTCGFEAELIFKEIDKFSDDDEYGEFDQTTEDRLAYSDNEVEIVELYQKLVTDVDNQYGEAFYNYQMSMMSTDLEDEDWLDDFVKYGIKKKEVQNHKKEALKNAKADDIEEYKERLEWDNDAWGRELAELKYTEEMQDYWMENLDDHRFERIFYKFAYYNNQYGVVPWLDSNANYGTELWDKAHELLGEPDTMGDQEESPRQVAYREVEEWLEGWVSKSSSQKSDIAVGNYHDTTDHDGWRIEEDGSLRGDGQGFEVISPVYETPADMLKDLQSIIEYANAQGDVKTNNSTGLHITMSYDEESDMFPSIARTKMLVLSGSDWVAKAWGREFNSYTKPVTVQVLKALTGIATGNATQDNIKTMDDMIERFDDAQLGSYGKIERGSSLNFKREKNDKGNNLVEFRAAGNSYLSELPMIKKDVVRHSALVQGTYDPDAHNKEFAKKMYKMLQAATDKEFDSPDVYDQTRGLTPDDVYRQNTGDRDTKVDDQELTKILMKYAHRDIQPDVKNAISNFYRSIRTYNQFKNAPKDDEPQKQPPAPEPEELKPLWEDAEEDQAYDLKLRTDIAVNLGQLIVKLILSPNTDKMPAKEVMTLRRLLKQHGVQLDKVLSDLEFDVKNDNKIPDARDKQDISRIYRRAGRLLGKDLSSHIPKGKDIVVPPGKVLLLTHDALRDVMRGADPMEEFIFMDKLDWQYALDVCEKINQAYDQWQLIHTDPNSTEQERIEAQVEFSKKSHAGADLLWKRNKLDVDKVTGVATRRGKPNYVPFKNGEQLFDAKDVPMLKDVGVVVQENNIQETSWETLMMNFEDKPLQEQVNLLGKLDKQKIDEAWAKKLEEADQVKTKERKPKTIKPNTGHQSNHPYQGRLVGEDAENNVNEAPLKSFDELHRWQITYNNGKTRTVRAKTSSRARDRASDNPDLHIIGIRSIKDLGPINMVEGAVPDTSLQDEYRQIMSKPLLGSDLKGQMYAYQIVPDPAMIKEFRKQISMSGKDCDLRQVFKSFAKTRLHPMQQKKAGLSEAILLEGGISVGDLGKRNNFDVFKRKIASSQPFDATDGAEVIIAPTFARKIKTVDDLKQFVQNRQVMLPLKNDRGYVVPLSYLLKTAEFGGTAKKETGVANRGELAEGVLGAATFARIAKRPGKPITYDEVLKVIQSLPKTDTGGSISKNVKTGGVTDKITLTVRLGANTYADLIDTQKLTSDALMNSYIKSTVQFVNDYTRLYANFFEQNGRPDEVEIVSDGVSENTDRKTDVYMIYVDETGNRQLKHFDISLKAGTVKQFGQVGYGRSTSPIENRFAKVMELFTQFGVDQNSFTFRPEQFQDDDSVALIRDLYKQAVSLINRNLGTDKKEYNYLEQLAQGVTYFATSNDPTVKLLQLDKGRYFVLDFKKLLPKLRDIDLQAHYAETSAGDPIVRIHDKNNPKTSGRLLQIRTKNDNGYIRQILEKEPLLKKLISVRHVGDIEK